MATVSLADRGDGVVSIGRVFSRAFSFIAANPATALGSAVLFGALPSLLNQALTFGTVASYERASAAAGLGLLTLQLLSSLVALVFSGLMQAVMTFALVTEHEGMKPTLGACMARGLRHAIPIVLFTILWSVAIAIGFALLIVPGVILICMWAVAVPALAEENTGIIGAFGRSRELTRGHRWKVFGLLLVIMVGFYLIMAVLGVVGITRSVAALGDLENGPPLLFLVATAISGLVFSLLWSTIQPSLFLELRDAKEGGSNSDLQQVFS